MIGEGREDRACCLSGRHLPDSHAEVLLRFSSAVARRAAPLRPARMGCAWAGLGLGLGLGPESGPGPGLALASLPLGPVVRLCTSTGEMSKRRASAKE